MKHKYTNTHCNLRVQAAEWGFFTEIPKSTKRSTASSKLAQAQTTINNSKHLPGIEMETLTSLHTNPQRSSTFDAAEVRSRLPHRFEESWDKKQTLEEEEAEAADIIKDISKDHIVRLHNTMWKESDNKLLINQGWVPFDVNTEKPSKMKTNSLLLEKAKMMRNNRKMQYFKPELSRKKRLVTSLSERDSDENTSTSDIKLKAFMEKKLTNKFSYRNILGTISPQIRRGATDPLHSMRKADREKIDAPWWLYQDKGLRQLLGEYSHSLHSLRALNDSIHKSEAEKHLVANITLVHHLPEPRVKQFYGTNLKKLKNVRIQSQDLLQEQKKDLTIGKMKDLLDKILSDSHSLADWSINHHSQRKLKRNTNNHIAKFIKSMKEISKTKQLNNHI